MLISVFARLLRPVARRGIATLVLSALLLVVAMVATASGPAGPLNNPDMPPFGNLDESQYLRMRAEHIATLRGVPAEDPAARTNAIRQLEQQEARRTRAASNGVGWTFVGPAFFPNGQTTTVPNAVSGRVTAIDVHPTNPNIAYVGTAQGGVFRTLDGGTTWTPLMDGAQSLAIGAVTINPLTPTMVFVGTGESNRSADSFFGVGLYRIDNAESAPVVNGPFETRVAGTGSLANNGHAFFGTAISRIAVDPNDGNRIFVGNTTGVSGLGGVVPLICGGPYACAGLYFSSNAAAVTPVFSRVNTLPGGGLGYVTDIVFEPGSSNNVLVGVMDVGAGFNNSGIWRSTDAATASQVPDTSPAFSRVVNYAGTYHDIRFAINKVGATVTALAAVDLSGGRLIKSTDGGATFPTTLTAANGYCGGQCWYDNAVAMDPGNANLIYLGGAANGASSRVYTRSANGGTTFSGNGVNDVGLHADMHAVAVAPSLPATVYLGNDGGIFKSTDSGATWSSLNNATFSSLQFQSLALHPTDRNFMIGGLQDNGTGGCIHSGCTTNLTPATWQRRDYGDGGFSAIDQNAADTTNATMYHTYFNAASAGVVGFARVDSIASANDGTWTFYGCGGVANGIGCNNSLFYAPLVLGPGTPNTVYFGTDRLYRSANKGVTMPTVSQAPLNGTARISAIGIARSDDNVRVVGMNDGSLFGTTTGSSTLTNLDPSNVVPNQYVGRVAVHPTITTTAYVALNGYGLGTGQHVWKVTNLDSTPAWSIAGGTVALSAIPDVPVNAFVVDPSNPNALYAGTDIGVYQSLDGGATWAPFGSGLPRVAVFDVAIQNAHRVLRIATHGRGIWEIALASDLANRLYLPSIVR